LLEARPAALVIANRTAARAADLAERFAGRGPLRACGYPDLAGESFDLVINATSASLGGETPCLPERVFAPGSLAYDMMYGRGETPFLLLARTQGAERLADGLGMLVEQAAEAFRFWRGVLPDSAPVLAMLRAVAAVPAH
jgi:shikimate dehydrogenase